MKKIIDGVEYKVIKCKKYQDVLDCPIDYFDCINCNLQTKKMKRMSKNIKKENN